MDDYEDIDLSYIDASDFGGYDFTDVSDNFTDQMDDTDFYDITGYQPDDTTDYSQGGGDITIPGGGGQQGRNQGGSMSSGGSSSSRPNNQQGNPYGNLQPRAQPKPTGGTNFPIGDRRVPINGLGSYYPTATRGNSSRPSVPAPYYGRSGSPTGSALGMLARGDNKMLIFGVLGIVGVYLLLK